MKFKCAVDGDTNQGSVFRKPSMLTRVPFCGQGEERVWPHFALRDQRSTTDTSEQPVHSTACGRPPGAPATSTLLPCASPRLHSRAWKSSLAPGMLRGFPWASLGQHCHNQAQKLVHVRKKKNYDDCDDRYCYCWLEGR